MRTGVVRTGVVIAFDVSRGVGEIEAGDERFGFHATRIADGSRAVAVGSEVGFEIVPGLPGRWEATRVTKAR